MLVTTYFGWVSKEWQYIQIPTISVGVIGVIFLFLSPESPRFLVSVKRYNQARNALKKIATVNGLDPQIADKFIFPKE